MGVAILPRSDAVAPGADVAVVALVDPKLSRDITLAWRQDRRHPPAVTEFLALARTTFSEREVRNGSPLE
jgi:DNA-binding transcriptional LysR family regulator